MSDKIIIFDTTLRDGEQSPGASMNMQEKFRLAQQLVKLKVDVIEAGFPVASPGDIECVRNIAEHAVVGDSDDPLRNTRTTLAGWLERALVAPYYVNYHLEHHLFYYVPCYNLPKVHRLLAAGPHGARMEVAPGYAAVLRKATARPADEDRPGQLVHALRRKANENSGTSGF